jgi:hypothetical protein
MAKDRFADVKPGDRVTADGYNRRTQILERLANSGDGSGLAGVSLSAFQAMTADTGPQLFHVQLDEDFAPYHTGTANVLYYRPVEDDWIDSGIDLEVTDPSGISRQEGELLSVYLNRQAGLYVPFQSEPHRFYARIEARFGHTYSWIEQEDLGDGLWGNLDGGRSGSFDLNPAFELNRNAFVPINNVVLLSPGFFDDDLGLTFRFEYCCHADDGGSGSGSGGSGSHSGGGGGGGSTVVACCASPVPETLYATIQNVSGCACLDGLVVPIVFNGLNMWAGQVAACTGFYVIVQMPCGAYAPGFSLTVFCHNIAVGAGCGGTGRDVVADGGGSCDPFNESWSGLVMKQLQACTTCCLGTIDVIVTE